MGGTVENRVPEHNCCVSLPFPTDFISLYLVKVIQRNVQPGSLVYTDEWAAYRRMQRVLGFNHQTVNHSVNFVDPVTGVHTQHAESNWSVAKDKFKKMKGNTNPNFLQEYLKEFMWRRWHGEPHANGCFGRLMGAYFMAECHIHDKPTMPC